MKTIFFPLAISAIFFIFSCSKNLPSNPIEVCNAPATDFRVTVSSAYSGQTFPNQRLQLSEFQHHIDNFSPEYVLKEYRTDSSGQISDFFEHQTGDWYTQYSYFITALPDSGYFAPLRYKLTNGCFNEAVIPIYECGTGKIQLENSTAIPVEQVSLSIFPDYESIRQNNLDLGGSGGPLLVYHIEVIQSGNTIEIPFKTLKNSHLLAYLSYKFPTDSTSSYSKYPINTHLFPDLFHIKI